MNHNRDQNTEGSPGSSCGKRQENGNQENNAGQEVHETRRGVLHQSRHKFLGTQAVRHCLQRPGKGQNQDRGDHRLKSLRNTLHAFLKRKHPADQIDDYGDHQPEEGTEYQADRSVAARERVDKIGPGEKSSGVDHPDDAADHKGGNRNNQIKNRTLRAHFFF